MKKISLGILTILVTGSMYYFFSHNIIKEQVDKELITIQKYGVIIEDKKIVKNKEHFVVVLDNTTKILPYILNRGLNIDKEALNVFEGAKLGIDIEYSNSLDTSIILNLYPISLPSSLLSSVNEPKMKIFITTLQDMLKRKVFLTTLSFNKIGTSFQGHLKNIDEKIKIDTKAVHLKMNSANFKGTIKEDMIASLKEEIKILQIIINKEANLLLNNITSNYQKNGKSNFDYNAKNRIEKIIIQGDMLPNITISDLKSHSIYKVNNNLLSNSVENSIENITIKENTQKTSFNKIKLNISSKNIDINALEELINPSTISNINHSLQLLISKGITVDISNFSIKEIFIGKENLQGLKMNASIIVNKLFQMQKLQKSPMALLNALNGDLTMKIDDPLFSSISQYPKAIVPLMFFPPKAKEGYKYYKINLKDGALKINGTPAIGI